MKNKIANQIHSDGMERFKQTAKDVIIALPFGIMDVTGRKDFIREIEEMMRTDFDIDNGFTLRLNADKTILTKEK